MMAKLFTKDGENPVCNHLHFIGSVGIAQVKYVILLQPHHFFHLGCKKRRSDAVAIDTRNYPHKLPGHIASVGPGWHRRGDSSAVLVQIVIQRRATRFGFRLQQRRQEHIRPGADGMGCVEVLHDGGVGLVWAALVLQSIWLHTCRHAIGSTLNQPHATNRIEWIADGCHTP